MPSFIEHDRPRPTVSEPREHGNITSDIDPKPKPFAMMIEPNIIEPTPPMETPFRYRGPPGNPTQVFDAMRQYELFGTPIERPQQIPHIPIDKTPNPNALGIPNREPLRVNLFDKIGNPDTPPVKRNVPKSNTPSKKPRKITSEPEPIENPIALLLPTSPVSHRAKGIPPAKVLTSPRTREPNPTNRWKDIQDKLTELTQLPINDTLARLGEFGETHYTAGTTQIQPIILKLMNSMKAEHMLSFYYQQFIASVLGESPFYKDYLKAILDNDINEKLLAKVKRIKLKTTVGFELLIAITDEVLGTNLTSAQKKIVQEALVILEAKDKEAAQAKGPPPTPMRGGRAAFPVQGRVGASQPFVIQKRGQGPTLVERRAGAPQDILFQQFGLGPTLAEGIEGIPTPLASLLRTKTPDLTPFNTLLNQLGARPLNWNNRVEYKEAIAFFKDNIPALERLSNLITQHWLPNEEDQMTRAVLIDLDQYVDTLLPQKPDNPPSDSDDNEPDNSPPNDNNNDPEPSTYPLLLLSNPWAGLTAYYWIPRIAET